MNAAGYSATPLAKKLGFKDGSQVMLVNAPEHYFTLFTDMPAIGFVKTGSDKADIIHYFVTEISELQNQLGTLRNSIVINGSIWISWPKKSSGVPTTLNEDLIRQLAIEHGLVDVKVCAVDQTWSGLKLVIPLRLRR